MIPMSQERYDRGDTAQAAGRVEGSSDFVRMSRTLIPTTTAGSDMGREGRVHIVIPVVIVASGGSDIVAVGNVCVGGRGSFIIFGNEPETNRVDHGRDQCEKRDGVIGKREEAWAGPVNRSSA